nr:calcium-binding EF hand family protein [Tanacetum cinerariifolium]
SIFEFLRTFLTPEKDGERDTDKDGKVNFKEFFHGLFDRHNSSHESNNDSLESPARRFFAELNGCGFFNVAA